MLDKMSNASRLVEKLRVKGLVDRRVSKTDRRAVDVIITRNGLEVLKEIDTLNENFEAKFNTLTPEEMKKANDLLDKLRG
jgi:DNA-binding MarR family transcriptional regulator